MHKSGLICMAKGLLVGLTSLYSIAYVPEDGLSPLVSSAFRDDLREAKVLLEREAEVDSRTDGGSTVLMVASWIGGVEVVRLLLEKGADANAKAQNGITPLMAASKNGHTQVVELLKSHRAGE